MAGPLELRGNNGGFLQPWVSIPFTLEIRGVGLRETDMIYVLLSKSCNGTASPRNPCVFQPIEGRAYSATTG